MRVAIVDDEKNMTDQIIEFLCRYQKENSVNVDMEEFSSGESFLQSFYEKKEDEADGYLAYDMILLDVEMPGIDGIETARRIRERDKNVIIMFITNMAQYAIHGYSVEAIDYVLKPITYEDFKMKINKATRYIERNTKHQIMLNTTEGKIPISISDIYYIEVVRHYLHYYTVGGKYEVRGVMKELEKSLSDKNFCRCNQSYLINLAYVKAIRGNDVVVGDDYIPISRNKKNEFMEAFAKYVGGI
ncbi:MAG: LytTR family DNA-binding domain-containing protein [Lachnospiraceae bacterium]|nr:LytTR family DNA-binding domain-containing protein [Lachnospiraceae bacterium]